jgi:peptidyl-dipeptidase A
MALAVHHALHLTSIMKRHTSSVLLLLIASISPAFAETKSPIQERADRFLALANTGYQAVYRVNSEAQWNAVTDVTPEHDAAAEATGKAYAAFNGNAAIINESRELLTHQKELNEITVRQLKQLLLNAAEGPMTNPELVVRRVTAETKQASLMNGFEFKFNGQKITANEIDNKLEKSTDLAERKAVWEVSKEIGPALKPNLVTLRDLRNGVAKEMKYPDYFSLQVAAYGMTTDEMLKMLDDWMATLRPLYLQLHTWAKYKLAEKFHQPVPKKIPAHWLSNRWDKNGRGWLRQRILINISKAENRNGSSRRQNNFTSGSGSRRCRKVSGKNRICTRFRLIPSGRKTRTHSASISILRTTFALCKASNQIHGGFSLRIMSSGMATTSRHTRVRRFRTCCDSERRLDSMKA